MSTQTWALGGGNGSLRLTILGRAHDGVPSAWERDVVRTKVEIVAGALTATFEADVWCHNLRGLHSLLTSMVAERGPYAGRGMCYLQPFVGSALRIQFERTSTDAVMFDVEARPGPDQDTVLKTRIEAAFDDAAGWIEALDTVLKSYPPAVVIDGRSNLLASQEDVTEPDVDTVVALDVGCVPEAAISGPVLLQSDYRTFLTFNAIRKRPDGMREDAGTAVVEIKGCVCTQFGYPNDEALPGHPLYKKGLGAHAYAVYEVLRSSWVSRLEAQNRLCFPNTGTWRARHFVVTMHDSVFECIGSDLNVRVLDPLPEDLYRTLVDQLWNPPSSE